MKFRTEIGMSFVSGFLRVRHVQAADSLVDHRAKVRLGFNIKDKW